MSEFTLQQDKPQVYKVDATKATLEEMGILFNQLGIAMTREYAQGIGVEHLLLDEPDQE